MFEDNVDLDLDDDIISSSFSTSLTNTPTFALPRITAEFRNRGYNVSEPHKAVKPSISKQDFAKKCLEKTDQNGLSTAQSAEKTVSGIRHSNSGRPEETNGGFLTSTIQTANVFKGKLSGPAGPLTEDIVYTVNIEHLHSEGQNTAHALQDDDETCLQNSATILHGAPWVQMLHDLNFTDLSEESLTNRYNIRWIKDNANQRKLIDQKVPFLAAVIDNINANSTLTSINLTLKDPTGEIDAAILHTLYADYSDGLTIGSVIVLKGLGVFSPGSKHYLTITANNLVTIYSTDVGGDTKIDGSRSKNVASMNANACTNHKKGGTKKIIVQKMTNEDLVKEVNQMTNQSLVSSRVFEDLLHLNKPSTSVSQSKGQNPPGSSNSAFTVDEPCSSNLEVADYEKNNSNTQHKHSPNVQRQTTTGAPLKGQTVYFDKMLDRKRSKNILSLRSQCDINKNASNSNLYKHPKETVAPILGVAQNKSFSNEKENLNVDKSRFKKIQIIFGSFDHIDDFSISQKCTNDINIGRGNTTKEYIKNKAKRFELDLNQSVDEKESNNIHSVMGTTSRSKEDKQNNRANNLKADRNKISFEMDDDLDLAISQEFSIDMQVETGSITKEHNKNNRARNFELDGNLNLSIDEENSTNLNRLTRTNSRCKGTLLNNKARDFEIDDNKFSNFKDESGLDWATSQHLNFERGTTYKEGFKTNKAGIFELDDGSTVNFAKGTKSRATGTIKNNRANFFEIDEDVNLFKNEEFGISINFETDIKTKGEIPKKRASNSELVASKNEITNTIPLVNTTGRSTRIVESNRANYFQEGDINCSINELFSGIMNCETDIKTKGKGHNKRANNCELDGSKSKIRNTTPLAYTTSRTTRNDENNRANFFDADDINFSISEDFSTKNFKADIKSEGKAYNEIEKHELIVSKSDIKNSNPLTNTSDNVNVALQTRVSKVKSKLMKFRFQSRNNDVRNEKDNAEQKETFEGIEKDNLKPSEEPSVIISNSQLSVKTTNIEHNEIWKSALGDIDTESLFEDF